MIKNKFNIEWPLVICMVIILYEYLQFRLLLSLYLTMCILLEYSVLRGCNKRTYYLSPFNRKKQD